MEATGVWITVIGSLGSLLTVIVAAVITAMKMMWTRIAFLQDCIRDCEKLHGAANSMVARLEERVSMWEEKAQGREEKIESIQTQVDKINGGHSTGAR